MGGESEKRRRPPLAEKGRARPLPGGLPHAGDSLGGRSRPPGVHTRPELFGASAVVRRTAEEETDESAAPSEPEPRAEAAPENRDAPAPPASLLSQPWRITAELTAESVWSELPPAAPEAAGSDDETARRDGGEADTPPSEDAEVPPAPVAAAGLAQRWPLFAGLGIAAALVAYVVADGLLPAPLRESAPTQSAQAPEATGEPAAAGEAVASAQPPAADPGTSGEILLTPAAGEPPPGASPRPAAADPHGPALASRAEPGARAADATDHAPVVDFMRVDRAGRAIVAGRAAPGTELTILDNGETLGGVTADPYGLWSFVSAKPLSEGRHAIGIAVDSRLLPALAPLEAEAEPAEVESARSEAVPARTDAAGEAASLDETVPASGDDPAVQDSAAAGATEDLTLLGETEETASPPSQETEAAGAPAEPAAEAAPGAVQSAALPEGEAAGDAAGEGRYLIQLASFETAARAGREQADLRERFADLLSGLELFVDEAEVEDLGTVFRVRLGPFASLEEARAACARFEARAHDCLALRR